jgi:hypothetical protein
VIFGALAVAGDPAQVPTQLRGQLLTDILGPANPLGGVEPSLNPRGQLRLLLGAEQRNLADLRVRYARTESAEAMSSASLRAWRSASDSSSQTSSPNGSTWSTDC